MQHDDIVYTDTPIATLEQRMHAVEVATNIIQDYVHDFFREDNIDQDDRSMYLKDVAYMYKAIAKFIDTGSLLQLENDIMAQDTFVREYCIELLSAVEVLLEECNEHHYSD